MNPPIIPCVRALRIRKTLLNNTDIVSILPILILADPADLLVFLNDLFNFELELSVFLFALLTPKSLSLRESNSMSYLPSLFFMSEYDVFNLFCISASLLSAAASFSTSACGTSALLISLNALPLFSKSANLFLAFSIEFDHSSTVRC